MKGCRKISGVSFLTLCVCNFNKQLYLLRKEQMSVKHKKTVLFFGNLGAMQMQQLKHLRIKNRV